MVRLQSLHSKYVVMAMLPVVQVGYITRCLSLRDLHNLGLPALYLHLMMLPMHITHNVHRTHVRLICEFKGAQKVWQSQ